MSTTSTPDRRLYGRRRSHKLRPGRAELMATLADQIRVPLPEASMEDGGPIALERLFPGATEIRVEIGFGGGEHLAELARRAPHIGLIGCEHYVDGVAKLVSMIARDGLGNVRIHPHDARDLLDALPADSVSRVYLLYPDPWPKTRHHRRRFVNGETLDAVARILTPGGEYRIATDIPDYARHCLQAYFARRRAGARDLDWTAERAEDWRRPWPGWPGTRYERKALAAGRPPLYVTFRKR